MAKKENLPLKLPVLPEDIETIKAENRIPIQVVLNGLRKQVEISPDDYYASYLTYFIYEKLKTDVKEKNFENARLLLEEVKDSGLMDFRYNFYQGMVLKYTGFLGEAERELRESFSMSPKNPMISFEIARLLDESGNYDEALEFYTRTIEIDSRFLPAYMASADIFFRAKDYSTAQDLYIKCIELSDEFLPPYSRLGVIYNTEQNFEKAHDILIRGLGKFPDEIDLHYNFSFTCLKMGKPLTSIRHLKKCLEIDSKFVSAWNELSIIQKNFGFYDESLDSINQALKLDVESESVLWNNYRIALLCGAYSLAEKSLNKIGSLDEYEKDELRKEIENEMEIRNLASEFSVDDFARWALDVYEEIPQDIYDTLSSVENGILVHREFDKPGDMRFMDFFRDIFEEYSQSKIILEKALTLFSTACAGSAQWVAFSRAVAFLYFENDIGIDFSDYSCSEFDNLIDKLFEETKDLNWEFSKEISKYEYDKLRDWEHICEYWNYPCSLSEFLFLLLELLRIELAGSEENIIKEYDENLYFILLKIKSRWKNALQQF